MRIVPVLLLMLALALPATAQARGSRTMRAGHGGTPGGSGGHAATTGADGLSAQDRELINASTAGRSQSDQAWSTSRVGGKTAIQLPAIGGHRVRYRRRSR